MLTEYFIGLLLWLVFIWLLCVLWLSIRGQAFRTPIFINVFLAAVLVHAIAWLLGFSSAGILTGNFFDEDLVGHEEMVEIALQVFVDEFLSWILLLVSLFLIALRIKR